MIQRKIFIIFLLITIILNCKQESGKDNLLPLLNQQTSTTPTDNSKGGQSAAGQSENSLPSLPPVGSPATESATNACTTNLRVWSRNEFPTSSKTLTALDNGMVVSTTGDILSYFFPIANGAAWSFGPRLNLNRYKPAAAAISPTRVLISGGFDLSESEMDTTEILDTAGVQTFDPVTGELISDTRHINANSMNTPRGGHVLTVLADGRLLASGGTLFVGDTRSEIYNPATGQWTETGPIQPARIYHTATRLNDGRVMVVGGLGNTGTDSSSFSSTLIYNPQTDQWVDGPSLNQSRNAHTATLLQDGRLLVVGGDSNGVYRQTIEIYNPNTNNWTMLPMPGPRTEHGAYLEGDGSVVIATGRNTGLVQTTLRYNPNTDTWCHLPNIPNDGFFVGMTEPLVLPLPGGGATFSGILSIR
ncbi:Kelch repeat-containing protein [Leptospira interrogans]|uniref:Kelch repeat-containing protein n=1 Tax=Leptospira interrogans TaxID=173 RepID=UPI0007734957|nr:kelch repeat-containing protein [Leptospira interrogans]